MGFLSWFSLLNLLNNCICFVQQSYNELYEVISCVNTHVKNVPFVHVPTALMLYMVMEKATLINTEASERGSGGYFLSKMWFKSIKT